MKKNIFSILLIICLFFTCSFCLASCNNTPQTENPPTTNPGGNEGGNNGGNEGGNNNGGNGGGGNNPATHTHSYIKKVNGNTFKFECSCGDFTKGYKIQFIFAEDGSEADSGIEVTWTSANGGKHVATTNDMGYVEALNLTEDKYSISVKQSTLPVIGGIEYLYNTNEFSEQSNGVGLTIPLLSVHTPSNVDDVTGRLTSTEDRYAINLNRIYMATINNADDEVWYSVQNEGFGKYTVDATMSTGIDVKIERRFANIAYVSSTPDTDVEASQNKLTYKVVYTDAEQDSTFCFKAPNEKAYPVNVFFNVAITYTPQDENVYGETFVSPTHFETEACTYTYYTEERGSSTPIPNTTASLKPVAGVSKWQDVEGSIIKDLTSNELATMQLKSDGFYYAGNQLVYVKLNVKSIFEESTLASYLYDSGQFAIYNIVEYNEYRCCTRWENYFGFVQAYTALANSDGLYPLTNEMYLYLQNVAKKEHRDVFELLCTYPTSISNFTQGNGSQSSPYALTLSSQTFGNYNVSIPAGGKAYLKLSGNMDVALTYNSNVKATVNGSPYDEYVTVDGSETIAFETVDGSALSFVLHINEYDDPYYLELGSNHVKASPDVLYYSHEFAVTKTAKYDIAVSSGAVVVEVKLPGDSEYSTINGSITVDLTNGDSVLIKITTESETEIDFTIDIEENTLE